MSPPTTTTGTGRTAPGLVIALFSGFSFGLAGPFAASLLATGWSPLAVALGRLAGTAVLLAVPLVVVVARGWRPRPGHLRAVAVYGVVPLAGAQVCYFGAVERLSVGVALLIEYTAPVLLLGWIWRGPPRAPGPRHWSARRWRSSGWCSCWTSGGARPWTSSGWPGGWRPRSAWRRTSTSRPPPAGVPTTPTAARRRSSWSPAARSWAARSWCWSASSGCCPSRRRPRRSTLAGWTAPWWVGVALVAALSTALAYLTGIAAVGRLGSRLASFVGLSEVLFAVLTAWWLVAQRPTLTQTAGGVLIVVAVALIRSG